MKTGPRLSETCASGDPAEETTQQAYAIRDAWRFRILQPPNLVTAPKSIASKQRRSAPEVEEHALTLALRLGTLWAGSDRVLRGASEEGDAASVFCGLVLQRVRAGDSVIDDVSLRKLWNNSFIDAYHRALRREADAHAGLSSQEHNGDEPPKAGYEAFQHEALLATREQRDMAAHEIASLRLGSLSVPDRRLFDAILAWDDLQGKMTNARLGEQLGITEAAVRKQRKRVAAIGAEQK